jgi:hypothetical protein
LHFWNCLNARIEYLEDVNDVLQLAVQCKWEERQKRELLRIDAVAREPLAGDELISVEPEDALKLEMAIPR